MLILRGGDGERREGDEDWVEEVSLSEIRFEGEGGAGRIRSRGCLRGREV